MKRNSVFWRGFYLDDKVEWNWSKLGKKNILPTILKLKLLHFYGWNLYTSRQQGTNI